MKATTEYRYSGKNVNNYVNFNNETWRIIGVFEVDDGSGNYETRMKIIRDESIGDFSWDSSSSYTNDGRGINQWGESSDYYEGADLMKLLNTIYYNRTASYTCYNGRNSAYTSCGFSANGLSETAQNMIDDAKWYTAGLNYGLTTSTAYIEERGSALPPTGETYSSSSYNDSEVRTKSWIGKVVLLYPSDYGYASSSCYNSDTTLSGYDECIESNWLAGNFYWTLSPNVSTPSSAFEVSGGGPVYDEDSYNAYGASPVVYLKSNVKITGGTGENAENAYQLSL